MNAITGDYDVVIQVQESVVNSIFSAMHVAGAMQHRAVFAYREQRVDLQIGQPSIILLSTSSTDDTALALMTTRVILQLRPLDDASALGTGRVARITVRAAVTCVSGTNGQPAIKYDWADTAEADIVLAGSPDDQDLRTMLAKVVGRIHGVISASVAKNAAFRFLPAGSGNLVSIGLSLGATEQGKWDQLNFAFLGAKNWALALGREYFLGKIREEMGARWKGLPPPYGSSPVLISDQVVCTLEISDSCFDHARRRVYLDRFMVSLSPGAIIFSGTARAVTDAWYTPDVSADFSFACTVSLDTNQQLTLTMGVSNIDFNQWYAEVFNWLTFGALQDVVKNAFRHALLSDQAHQDLSGLFSSSVIGKLAALGKSVAVCTTPQADSVVVLDDAVIFSGSVTVAEASRSPVTDLIVLRRNGEPDIRIFQGGGSWAPGGDLAEVDWSFGDGSTVIQRGDDVRLAVEYRYLPGEYVAKLCVVDRAGRSFSHSTLVRVGLMSLGCASPVIERTLSPVTMVFNLMEEGEPLNGVTVTVSAGTWRTVGTTGQNGSVSFIVDPVHFVPLAHPYVVDDWWATHYLTVTAVKTGYRTETLTILLADRMLQLRGGLVIKQAGVANLNIGVFQQDAPVEGAEVVVTGKDKWQTQLVTPVSGCVQCAVDIANFIDLPQITSLGNGFCARAYVLVDANKVGYHPALQMQIYHGFNLPDHPMYQDVRQRFEKWWLWSMELSTAIDRGDLFDPSVVNALPDVMVAVSAFRGVLALGADASSIQVLSLAVLLGIKSGDEEGVIRRIEALCSTLERKLASLKKAAGTFSTHVEIIRPRSRLRPVAMKENWPKSAVGELWRARTDRLLATAEVTARLRPFATGLPTRCCEFLRLLSQISALERLPSRLLPAAELLGTKQHKSYESPASRLEALLMIAQKNIDALSANEQLEILR